MLLYRLLYSKKENRKERLSTNRSTLNIFNDMRKDKLKMKGEKKKRKKKIQIVAVTAMREIITKKSKERWILNSFSYHPSYIPTSLPTHPHPRYYGNGKTLSISSNSSFCTLVQVCLFPILKNIWHICPDYFHFSIINFYIT